MRALVRNCEDRGLTPSIPFDAPVEAISDPSTGLGLIRAALSRGIDVVSANKQAVGPGQIASVPDFGRAAGASPITRARLPNPGRA